MSEANSKEGESEAITYDFDPHNLPPEMLQAIGLVVASAAQTESIMQNLIGALLNIDEIETRALTAHMSAPLKDHIVRTLAELNAPSVNEVDFIDDLMDAVSAAFEKRNLIVHNALPRNIETGEVHSWREQARGSLKTSLKPITVEQLQKDAATIYNVGLDLQRFMMSRGVNPRDRVTPIHAPIDRGQKARAKRRDIINGNKGA